MVQPPRIELGSMVLQTTAMTTSAKVALADPERFELPTSGFEDQNSSTELRTEWWVVTVSNCRHSACKADALPTELTTRTWW